MASTATAGVIIDREAAPAQARHAKLLRLWLALIALLVSGMILLGGATRLTDSGLSITEWKPVTGTIPPLSEAHWQAAFDAYKQIPEYQSLKSGMDLAEFKTIYWWEWGHRFLGRLIGAAFFVPFIVFWFAGYIPKRLLPRLVGLFLLGGVQGAVGWYMVKSGLAERVDVSQYRLAIHLGIAFLILAYTLWIIFGLGEGREREETPSSSSAYWAGLFVLSLIFVQILAGALVAGLDAGIGFNTWPDMAGALVPEGMWALSPWYLNLFENRLTVQFDHRMLGYAVVLAVIGQAVWLSLSRKPPLLQTSGFVLVLLVLLQATLGVWTLLLSVPLQLALAHQAGAAILFGAALHHVWLARAGVKESTARAAQAAASA
jgi:cytochrome c oxidase assembly protein subunit 15